MMSPSSLLSQTAWHAADAPTMNSASQEDNATTRCFCESHVTGFPPRKKITPVVADVDAHQQPRRRCAAHVEAMLTPALGEPELVQAGI
ncbi:hypothetical protein U9M48_037193 [Paspalum notatum var. saurae]|uniref:Uncharacterized protein n=1 Tax=Paspalum notatum var. saurae TaxID=547442 RepID=A0AAQ3X9P2_PASNO